MHKICDFRQRRISGDELVKSRNAMMKLLEGKCGLLKWSAPGEGNTVTHCARKCPSKDQTGLSFDLPRKNTSLFVFFAHSLKMYCILSVLYDNMVTLHFAKIVFFCVGFACSPHACIQLKKKKTTII